MYVCKYVCVCVHVYSVYVGMWLSCSNWLPFRSLHDIFKGRLLTETVSAYYHLRNPPHAERSGGCNCAHRHVHRLEMDGEKRRCWMGTDA